MAVCRVSCAVLCLVEMATFRSGVPNVAALSLASSVFTARYRCDENERRRSSIGLRTGDAMRLIMLVVRLECERDNQYTPPAAAYIRKSILRRCHSGYFSCDERRCDVMKTECSAVGAPRNVKQSRRWHCGRNNQSR